MIVKILLPKILKLKISKDLKDKWPQIQKKKDTKLNMLAEKNVEKNYENVEQLIDDVRGEFENFEHDCIQMMEQVLGDLDDIKKYNKNEKIEELSTQFKSLKSRYTQSQKILPSHQKSENNKQYQQIIDQQDQIDYIDLDKDYELKEQYLKDINKIRNQ
ncbi:hypothetical protein PPERSA_02330 [Pseudocohnilembus persalinus]|uniref:Uncharacterized protein n=1 Tax=Pseudocohnilembus persalinus TaxID=266149 RepID=A0A0V0QUF1_PSEPJ|nr:hypothetical protein PPERSA_02330 [Pseudocohnilembus persalinus]|eukprot:KRX05798.1 hypothetical protein PPERSA_02330 [Pseudocohnilembus persalinus]